MPEEIATSVPAVIDQCQKWNMVISVLIKLAIRNSSAADRADEDNFNVEVAYDEA